MDLIILDYTLSSLLSLSLQYTATYIHTKRKESIVTLYHLHLDPWPLYYYTHICALQYLNVQSSNYPHYMEINFYYKQSRPTKLAFTVYILLQRRPVILWAACFFLKSYIPANPDQKIIPTVGRNLFKRVCSTVSVSNFETIFKEILIRFKSSLYKFFYYNPNFSSEK